MQRAGLNSVAFGMVRSGVICEIPHGQTSGKVMPPCRAGFTRRLYSLSIPYGRQLDRNSGLVAVPSLYRCWTATIAVQVQLGFVRYIPATWFNRRGSESSVGTKSTGLLLMRSRRTAGPGDLYADVCPPSHPSAKGGLSFCRHCVTVNTKLQRGWHMRWQVGLHISMFE